MNTPIPPTIPPAPIPAPGPARRPRRRRIFLAFAVFAPLALLGAVVLAVINCFWVGSEVRAMRNAVFGSGPARFHKRVEVSAGWAPFALARWGAGFASVPSEATALLRAARAGEASISRLDCGSLPPDPAALLQAADAAMDKKGWDRLTGVARGRDLVAVYVPRGAASSGDFRVCVLTLAKRDLVCASARVDLAPLLELVREKAGPEWDRGALALADGKPSLHP